VGGIRQCAIRRSKNVTVTKIPGEHRCAWCGRTYEVKPGRGRPPRYCRRSCRQREYEANRRAKELGLNESELVVARDELEQLRDALYVLEAAVQDVERDLSEGTDDRAEIQQALDWLLAAARPLLELRP
jgi:hypothetical protein